MFSKKLKLADIKNYYNDLRFIAVIKKYDIK